MEQCQRNNNMVQQPDEQDIKMYDDFGEYNIWYLQNFGYEVNWLIKLNWEMFRAIMDDDGDKIHHMTQTIVSNVRARSMGMLN